MQPYEKLSYPLPIVIADDPSHYKEPAHQFFKALDKADYKAAVRLALEVSAPSLSEHLERIMNCFDFPACEKGKFKGGMVRTNATRLETFKRKNAVSMVQCYQVEQENAESINQVATIFFSNRLFNQIEDRIDISMEDLLARDLHKVQDDIRVWSELTGLKTEKMFLGAPKIHRKVFTPEVSVIPDFEVPISKLGERDEFVLGKALFEFPARYKFGGIKSNFGLIYKTKHDTAGPWFVIDSVVTMEPELLSQINKSDPSLLTDLAHLFRATAHDHIHTCVFHSFLDRGDGLRSPVRMNAQHHNWFGRMGTKENIYAMEYEHHAAVTKLEIWNQQISKNPKQKQELIDLSVQYLGKVEAFLKTENDPMRRAKLAEHLVCIGTYPVFGVLDPNGPDIVPIRQAIASIPLPEAKISLERFFHVLYKQPQVPETYGEQVKILRALLERDSSKKLGVDSLKKSLEELGVLDETKSEAPTLSGYDLVRFKILEQSKGAYEDTHKRRKVFDGNREQGHGIMTNLYASALGSNFVR